MIRRFALAAVLGSALVVSPGSAWSQSVPEQDHNFRINPGLNDAWFNPATSGQGFFIIVFPLARTIFLSWFTYDVTRPDSSVVTQLGEPGHRWLTAQGEYSGHQAVLDVYVSSGGVFDSAAPEVSTVRDGEIVLEFSGCNSGTVSYDIPSIGKQGTVPIERIVLDNVVLCESMMEESEASAAAKAYIEEWLPDYRNFYLSNTEIRAMINGGMGTRSYARDMAEIISANTDGGLSADAMEQLLRDHADGDTSNAEFWLTMDPFQFDDDAFRQAKIVLFDNATSGLVNTKIEPNTFGMVELFELIRGYDSSGVVIDGFLLNFVTHNPELYGGEEGGEPYLLHDPTWASQNPN